MHQKLKAGIEWRFRSYIEPTIDLYGSLPQYFGYNLQLKTKVPYSPVVYIYANRRNVGDYISYRGVKEIVGLEGGELYCSNGWSQHMAKYLKMCKEKGIVAVIGGGGLLQPAFEAFWQEILTTKVDYVLVGIGINKMEGRPLLNSDLMAAVVENAKWCGVRDTYSASYLHSIASVTVSIGICPSVNFISKNFSFTDAPRTNKLLHVYHPSDIRMAGAELAKIVDNLKRFSQENGLVYEESDNMGTDFKSAINNISSAMLVVSSRLHGCIMSIATGTNFVPLYCDVKTQNFVKTHTELEGHDPAEFHDYQVVANVCRNALNVERKVSLANVEKKIAENYAYGNSIRYVIESISI